MEDPTDKEKTSQRWATVFGKTPPPGFDFDKADVWTKDEWMRLCKTDVIVGRRLSLVVEMSLRDLSVLGQRTKSQSPFADELERLSTTLIFLELADVNKTVEALKKIVGTASKS